LIFPREGSRSAEVDDPSKDQGVSMFRGQRLGLFKALQMELIMLRGFCNKLVITSNSGIDSTWSFNYQWVEVVNPVDAKYGVGSTDKGIYSYHK
jgi:hypothetical protein